MKHNYDGGERASRVLAISPPDASVLTMRAWCRPGTRADFTLLCALALMLFSALLVISCGRTEIPPEAVTETAVPAWATQTSGTSFLTVTESPDYCRDCLTFERQVALGATDAPGFLEPTSNMHAIVRDIAGNFWVGQAGMVKVFAAQGNFRAQVGRPGQGPFEFQTPRPVHADRQGRVHIIDVLNGRETIVGPDLKLVGENRLPGFLDAIAPLHDGSGYVARMWVQAADRLGLPLHIIKGDQILSSFGQSNTADGAVQTHFTSRRRLTTDSSDRIFSAEHFEYRIEAWSQAGTRLAGFEGPQINRTPPKPGRFTNENPPASQIRAIHADDAERLWVLRSELKADWRDAVVEAVATDGSVALRPRDDDDLRTVEQMYQTRIDVLDLNTASIIASSEPDGVFVAFLGDGLLASVSEREDANLQIVVWKATFEE